ncbi:helix-turn-helix domain-containing protein [Janibacter cremeus]|uniref:helix-turn-helix transcriptional regulator n=1 Tax=Janibacter cremeus TaxID=1285192 RepID=UPI0023F6554C|nr:helix-turn-helix domain-containing protein [Janibacter cremeus]WEV79537.1 helix-turn-helix domain-containing protein [Janibacter cremeus]
MTVSEESTRGSTGSGDTGAGLLRSAVRREIVATLANLPGPQRTEGLSARELGDLVGLHVTTVRFHLAQLVEGGLLTSRSVRTAGAGRPTKKYLVAPGSLDRPLEAYRLLATLLTETFGATDADGRPLDPEQVGISWAREHVPHPEDPAPARTAGEWLSTVGRLVDTLRVWGYTPSVRTEDTGRTARIDLLGCPFIDLAKAHPEVACGIHRGLIRGTLEVLGERDTDITLEPFAVPTHCLAHVTTRADFAPRGGNS